MFLRDLRGRRLNPGAHALTSGVFLIATCLAHAACHGAGSGEPGVDVAWTLSPAAPAVGPATLTATLQDRAGEAITGAKVRLEAHMSHAGMAPVLANGTEVTPGTYTITFMFTMKGDWVLLLSATLADGRRLERRIDVPHVGAS